MNIWHIILLITLPLAGGILGYLVNSSYIRHIKLMLAFAGSYLLAVVLIHLIPHIFEQAEVFKGVVVLFGFLFQFVIERFSQGVEHGHFHEHDTTHTRLIPLQILVSLSLHSFMEGMPLGSNVLTTERAQWSFVSGIVLHEFPAAFALTTILKSRNKSRIYIFAFAAIYASMSSLGALTAHRFGSYINHEFAEYIIAFVAGTFLHIATTILFENSENHTFTFKKAAAIMLGIAVAYMVSGG